MSRLVCSLGAWPPKDIATNYYDNILINFCKTAGLADAKKIN